LDRERGQLRCGQQQQQMIAQQAQVHSYRLSYLNRIYLFRKFYKKI
jgi:hypothetical protein